MPAWNMHLSCCAFKSIRRTRNITFFAFAFFFLRKKSIFIVFQLKKKINFSYKNVEVTKVKICLIILEVKEVKQLAVMDEIHQVRIHLRIQRNNSYCLNLHLLRHNYLHLIVIAVIMINFISFILILFF